MARRPAEKPNSSLRQRAHDRIKQNILEGVHAPGSLLSENQLADELGISRTPVREAVRDLVSSGLVTILPQRGIVVTELTVKDINELYQVRQELECLAVNLAMARMTKAHQDGLRADHRRAVAALGAGRIRQAYDHAVLMHGRIVHIAGNAKLSRFMDQLADEAHRYGLLTLRSGHARRAISDHGEIIDAMLGDDAGLASELMRSHLERDRLLALRAALPAEQAGGLVFELAD